ncbi:MAG TPA: hypothetical protein VH370_26830 [Humisphaera sp.]|jgi:hypothetical protein|nr:hypothetical protein [Humisphaera sp.]
MPDDSYTFPLAWRWTQPSHNVLPPEVMAQIVPIPHAPMPPGVTARGEFDRSSFSEIQTASADIPCDQGTKWLRELPIALTEQVIVQWNSSTAVRTTWEIFTQYWDDFCYPSSDDVEVVPQSGEWVLMYHHWEVFGWGRRQT